VTSVQIISRVGLFTWDSNIEIENSTVSVPKTKSFLLLIKEKQRIIFKIPFDECNQNPNKESSYHPP